MKKLLILVVLFVPCCMQADVSLECDAAAFFPTNKTVRTVYGKTWQSYGLTVDHVQPWAEKMHPLSFFGKVNWLFKQGVSENGQQKTHIKLTPITVGLKWIQKVHDAIEVYAGIGPRYYFMSIHNDAPFYVPESTSDSQWGVYLSVGSFFYPARNLMVSLFFDYSYGKFKAPVGGPGYVGFSTNVSGCSVGAGFGWEF